MALSADRTHLVSTFTNTPVFITGDEPWSLIVQPDDRSVETYLADRQARGSAWRAPGGSTRQVGPQRTSVRSPTAARTISPRPTRMTGCW